MEPQLFEIIYLQSSPFKAKRFLKRLTKPWASLEKVKRLQTEDGRTVSALSQEGRRDA